MEPYYQTSLLNIRLLKINPRSLWVLQLYGAEGPTADDVLAEKVSS